ncbi:intradiol ring-cleavage dioxygenase [Actinoplanes subglobosus]|uniref:Intradiol ring-cleavage dioxygenase n=1 Tax=Actinoplanes subglobosus TaxID=1547892 RepID=A0ABV8IKJ4_9ACTN
MNDTNMHDEADNADVSQVLLNRRRLLTLGGVATAAAGLTALGGWAGTATAAGKPVSAAEAAAACALSSESIEGPYYLDYLLLRRNVTEDRIGVPLNLNLRVIDAATCRPIRGAGIEIWYCDSLGVYSGYTDNGSGGGTPPPAPGPTATPSGDPSGPPPGGGGGGGGHQEPTDDLTFLRGLQITDRNGFASFLGIVPGWYAGRALHIHTKVHTEGTATPTGYVGGHTCHTGQFYFEETLATKLELIEPYVTNETARVTLDSDFLYDGTGSTGGLLSLRYDPRRVERGVKADITVSVDPTATNDGQNGGFPVPSASA